MRMVGKILRSKTLYNNRMSISIPLAGYDAPLYAPLMQSKCEDGRVNGDLADCGSCIDIDLPSDLNLLTPSAE